MTTLAKVVMELTNDYDDTVELSIEHDNESTYENRQIYLSIIPIQQSLTTDWETTVIVTKEQAINIRNGLNLIIESVEKQETKQ